MDRQRALTHVQQPDTRKLYCLTVMQFDAARFPGHVIAKNDPQGKSQENTKK